MLQEQEHVADEPDENLDEDGESDSELKSDEDDEIPQASQAPTGRRSVLGFIGGLFGRTPVRPTSVILRLIVQPYMLARIICCPIPSPFARRMQSLPPGCRVAQE